MSYSGSGKDVRDGQAPTSPASRMEALLNGAYQYSYLLGLQTARYFKRALSHLGQWLGAPIRGVGAFLRLLLLTVDRFAFRSAHAFAVECRFLRTEIKNALKYLRVAAGRDRAAVPAILGHFIKKGVARHRGLFKKVACWAIPAAACVVMAVILSYWNGAAFALEVKYQGETVGLVANEAVFLDARQQVESRMVRSAQGDGAADAKIETPSYQIRLARRDELMDASALCDQLIEQSAAGITNACGVYIDGSFLCSVKNETDATSVFDVLLEPVREQNPGARVDFVENVTYEQGLYPDDETIWDASRLRRTLQGTKEAAVTHTVGEGETVSAIAQLYGKSSDELYQMNPGLTETIRVGQQITVSMQVNFVRVKTMLTRVRAEEIAYQTIEVENSQKYKGTRTVKTEGASGSTDVTELVSYVNGVVTGVEELARTVTREPVNEVIEVGVKMPSYSGGSGSVSGSGRFIWPTVNTTVTTNFGDIDAWHPTKPHTGMDIAGSNSKGKPIYAADDGVVVRAGNVDDGYGISVIIDHGDGFETLYGHCSAVNVRYGQTVQQGDVIAFVGNTGYSSGDHLHFSVIKNGIFVDPRRYL